MGCCICCFEALQPQYKLEVAIQRRTRCQFLFVNLDLVRLARCQSLKDWGRSGSFVNGFVS